MEQIKEKKPVNKGKFIVGLAVGIAAMIFTFMLVFALPLVPYFILGFVGYIIYQYIRRRTRYAAGLTVGYALMILQAGSFIQHLFN